MEKSELDWPIVLQSIATEASSLAGKKQCLHLSPKGSPEKALQAISHIFDASFVDADTIPNFSAVDEIPPIVERLGHQGVLEVRELACLRQFFHLTLSLTEALQEQTTAWAKDVKTSVPSFKSQLSSIDHVVSPDGEINESASQKLQGLCQERRKLERDVTAILSKIVGRQDLEGSLQDKYVTNREGRKVIPVKSGNRHDVKGQIHDRSHTKQTVFMEPAEAVPLNNRLRQIGSEIDDEIQRILKEISDYLRGSCTEYESALDTAIQADSVFAKVRFNSKIKGSKPNFSSQGLIKLNQLKHPLLLLQGDKVVANDVKLSHDNRILLLSGPNAGGKTILLKSIGLAAQMARSGLPIAAGDNSQLPFFEKLDPIVGDLQSVDGNLSTYSSHIKRLNGTLAYSGSSTMILVDEICGATDPEEGAALARSFIEHYRDQDVFAVITSHLGPLKQNWPKNSGVEHGSLEFDRITNRATYQLVMGLPGHSLALFVAQQLGTPQNLIDKAKEFLSPLSRSKAEELKEIEDFKQQVIDLKQQSQKDREEAQKLKQTYQFLVQKFRDQRDKWIEKALEKAQSKIENLIEDARQERIKNRTLQDLKADLPSIVKASKVPTNSKPQTIDEFKTRMPPGTPAFSTRLGRDVVIQGQPDNKGQVSVLAGSMRLQVPWHSLGFNKETEGAVSKKSSTSQETAVSSETKQLDLRGYRIDDAVEKLEKWLDNCMSEGIDKVKLIHGFGTEKLKKSVRRHLSKSPYVEKWTGGEHSEGDGITWVFIK